MIRFNNGLTVGPDAPVRVNCNVGCNHVSEYNNEKQKLFKLKEEGILPDMMMDLSLADFASPLYETIRDDLGLAFGTVLSYQGFSKALGLHWNDLRNRFLNLCQAGLSFITVHFTADSDLLYKAKQQRFIPVTSRGGGIVLYDSIQNNRSKNLFREHIEDIASIALTYDVVISLGTTFRPGTILDACDDIHIEETRRQLEVCKILQNQGVKVMVENVGHISLDKFEKHAKLLQQFNAPIMPLGPLPTDTAVNEDHISNAIGSSYAAYIGVAHVINCVSRYEHSHSRIGVEQTIEAIRTARVVAQIANVAHGVIDSIYKEKMVTIERAKHHCCFADGTSCARCSKVCPLKLI